MGLLKKRVPKLYTRKYDLVLGKAEQAGGVARRTKISEAIKNEQKSLIYKIAGKMPKVAIMSRTPMKAKHTRAGSRGGDQQNEFWVAHYITPYCGVEEM